jgi:ubiquitin-protein ligase
MNPRLRRLQADYDQVRQTFSGHPNVSIDPIGALRPPETYRVTYRLRGLYLSGDQPAYRELHEVDIMLPRRYPADQPYVVPLTPVFHPNIRDYFCIADYWAAGTTLADVIVKLGDMIQWRVYNTASPLDAIAARWAAEQEPAGLFPIGGVDLGVADIDITIRSQNGASPGKPDATVMSATAVLAPLSDTGPSLGTGPEAANPDGFVVTLRQS